MSTQSLYTLLSIGEVQSQLAAAAYATFTQTGTILLRDLKDAGMSPPDATAFKDAYTVVRQYADPITGMSATVFQNVDTGERYLAIKGTDNLQNEIEDCLVAVGAPVQVIPGYGGLQTQVYQWIQEGTLPDRFTVAGYSLGGYLVAALLNDFTDKISQGYGFNVPGTGGIWVLL